MANIEDRVINVGFIAAFMAAGYVLFTLFRHSAADGACDALSSIYCSLTGGTAVRDGDAGCRCVPVTPEQPVDEHGCYVGYQHWCQTDQKCLDAALACTPDDGCKDCYEWSSFYKRCLFSITQCKDDKVCEDGSVIHSYLDCPPCKKTKACSDGSYVCPSDACPPYNPPPSPLSCTCNGVVYDHIPSSQASGRSCAQWCDEYHPVPVPTLCHCGPDDFPDVLLKDGQSCAQWCWDECAGGAILRSAHPSWNRCYGYPNGMSCYRPPGNPCY